MWNEQNPKDDFDDDIASRVWSRLSKKLGFSQKRRFPTTEEAARIAKRRREIQFEKFIANSNHFVFVNECSSSDSILVTSASPPFIFRNENPAIQNYYCVTI